MPSRRMLLGGNAGSFPAPPWPAEYLTLAHNNDYAGGGSFDNYLHAFTSPDGVTWTKIGAGNIGGSIYSASAIRDPALLYHGGKWWAAAQGGGLRVFSSPSFIDSWSLIASPASVAGATDTWAPSWFVDIDGSVHVIFPASTDSQAHWKLYETHPTNDAWTTWSTPVEITGSGWHDSRIDPQITYWAGSYYLFWKQDSAGTICLSGSYSLLSGYTVAQTGDWAGWKGASGSIEGSKIVDIGTGWRIYFTHNSGFDATAIYYSETTDRSMMTGWSARTAIASLSGYNHPMPINRLG